MQFYPIILYLFFGVMPSLAWLFYYLQKDLHPEPKRMIIKVFTYGALGTVPLFFIQIGLMRMVTAAGMPAVLTSLATWFLVVALTEELLKYLVVRFSVLNSADLDEPLDIMLYMVVAALGFAAAENVLYLFSPVAMAATFGVAVAEAVKISLVRFLGATFLHTLCSAMVGYFLALATLRPARGRLLVLFGLLVATGLHGLYNFSIMTLGSPWNLLLPIGILAVLAWFMMYDFDEIKKIKSICKL